MNIATADRLVQLRKATGLSQEALASKLGVSRQAISKWERAEASPDTDNLIALADLYGMTLDQLLSTENDKYILNTQKEEPKQEPKKEKTERQKLGLKMLKFPFPLLAIILYLIIGFAADGWHPWWIIMLTIPIYYHMAAGFSIRSDKGMILAMPVPEVIVALYLIGGFCFKLWHPLWLIFFIIPLYYWIFAVFYKNNKSKESYEENNEDNDNQDK